MAKVVVASETKRKRTATRTAAVGEKRVRDASTGQFLTVRTLDGRSKTFSADLTYVFGRNVAKARRENKQVTGVTDRAPAQE